MNRKVLVALLVVAILVVAVEFLVILGLLVAKGDWRTLTGKESVVVIRIDDIIYDAKTFTDRIDLYKDREDVKAVVLRMETPGGTVAASQELTNAVMRLQDSGKIVVTSIGNLGASGGYYVASRSDLIVVNPGSLTGSIGVIMEHMEVSRLTERLGIRFDAITSGAMKDAGSVTRPMRPEERQMLKDLIDNAYAQFREEVFIGRREAIARAAGVDAADTEAVDAALDRVADGRIMTGSQAVDAGLADEIGDLEDAIDLAAERAGIKEEPNVIHDKPEDPWAEFREAFGMARDLASGEPARILKPAGLYYLYR